MALELLRQPGFMLLSEDTPLLDRRGRILPFPLRLGVQPEQDTRIPPRYLRTVRRMKFDPKRLIDIEYSQDRLGGPVEPGLVLVGQRNLGEVSEIVPLARHRALKALVPISPTTAHGCTIHFWPRWQRRMSHSAPSTGLAMRPAPRAPPKSCRRSCPWSAATLAKSSSVATASSMQHGIIAECERYGASFALAMDGYAVLQEHADSLPKSAWKPFSARWVDKVAQAAADKKTRRKRKRVRAKRARQRGEQTPTEGRGNEARPRCYLSMRLRPYRC